MDTNRDIDHVAEAIAALGYLKSEFAEPLAALMPRFVLGESPHAVARAIRREGTQISVDDKRALGLRSNAFMSIEALAMMTEKGRAHPLEAIENTLLRALFRYHRYRNIQNVRDSPKLFGHPAAAKLTGVISGCPGCRGLNVLITNPDKIEAAFPVPGCVRDACPVLVEIHLDFYHNIK